MKTVFIDFFCHNGKDFKNRSFEDILLFSNNELEFCHDYIQWVFPTIQVSQFNTNVPELTNYDLRIIRNNEKAIDRILRMNKKMENFYELAEGVKVYWWDDLHNHNLLRITRILTFFHSLKLKMFDDIALQWFERIKNIQNTDSVEYFKKAIGIT